jgi:hypothetical protein
MPLQPGQRFLALPSPEWSWPSHPCPHRQPSQLCWPAMGGRDLWPATHFRRFFIRWETFWVRISYHSGLGMSIADWIAWVLGDKGTFFGLFEIVKLRWNSSVRSTLFFLPSHLCPLVTYLREFCRYIGGGTRDHSRLRGRATVVIQLWGKNGGSLLSGSFLRFSRQLPSQLKISFLYFSSNG